MCYNRAMIGKRAIAFDIGNKRIGVAISDPFNEYAMPCETYNRTGKFWQDVEAIAKIAKERGVGVIVCGIPYNFDGSESIQTVKTREFIQALQEKTDLPVLLEDERFTTMQARETQIAGGIKREDRKKTIDSIAASYILEAYLIREKQKNKKLEETKMEKEKDLQEDLQELEDGVRMYAEDEFKFDMETPEGPVAMEGLLSFDYKEHRYCACVLADPQDEEEESLVAIFAVTEHEDGEEYLDEIEDDDLLDEVFAEFSRLYDDFADSDEAAALDM